MARTPAAPSPTSHAEHGEHALLSRIRRRAALGPATPELALGIGDDCALLQPAPGDQIVVTTDFCLEGGHWRRDWNTAASAGHRTLARGLSDIAAMGARPIAAFLSLALPAETARDTAWLDGFLDGLLGLAALQNVPLAGGDTAEAPDGNVLADIVLVGALPAGTALCRTGARPGDVLYCTGALGGSAAELHKITHAAQPRPVTATADTKVHPFLFPQPRVAAGQALRSRALATACMDLSDGLSTDLHHLCETSRVSADVDWEALPQSRLLRDMPEDEARHAVLHGGEDYELLFTASPATVMPQKLGGVNVTRIGHILPRSPGEPVVTLRLPNGRIEELAAEGWEHLR